MTEDEIEIALQLFGQIVASNTRRYEGTGLELPLAKRLAELHGGSLQVNTEKGRGTTVRGRSRRFGLQCRRIAESVACKTIWKQRDPPLQSRCG